jgi:hypothetical protein
VDIAPIGSSYAPGTAPSLVSRLDETEVVKRTQGHLADHDEYTRLAGRPKRGRGPDLTVRHRRTGHYFIVEAKGEGGGEARDAKMESMIAALGQLTLRFTSHQGRRYGLAFPLGWRQRALGKLSEPVVQLLRLHLFLVGPDGQVQHLTPRQLKSLVRAAREHA